MEQRERLIDTLTKTFDEQYEKRMLITPQHTADSLLADGWIRPPCKVGDTLFYIPFGKIIEKCVVHAVQYEEKEIVVKCHIWNKEREGLLHKQLVYFNDDDFSKTVFLTKEEAEAELERRKK